MSSYILKESEIGAVINYIDRNRELLDDVYGYSVIEQILLVFKAEQSRCETDSSLVRYDICGEIDIFEDIRKVIDQSRERTSYKMNIVMKDVKYMLHEVGVELDTYYLVLGVDEDTYGQPSLHVAEYSDLEDDIPLEWYTEAGVKITKVTMVSSEPLPWVDFSGNLIKTSD